MGAESVQSETERARSGGARGDRGEGAVGAEGAALSGPPSSVVNDSVQTDIRFSKS